MAQAGIRAFFDEATKAVTYLVWDKATGRGVVIDAVRDFDAASGQVGTRSVDLLLGAAADEGVRVEWALETHVHADHLSGAPLVKARTGAKIAIDEHVRAVQPHSPASSGARPAAMISTCCWTRASACRSAPSASR